MSVIRQLMLDVEQHGARLVVTAPDKVKVVGKPLPAELLEQLRAHKSELLTLLLSHEEPHASWKTQDWLDCFEERAAILEYEAGLVRAEAEHQSLAHVFALWLNSHLPKVATHVYNCVDCGRHVSCEKELPLRPSSSPTEPGYTTIASRISTPAKEPKPNMNCAGAASQPIRTRHQMSQQFLCEPESKVEAGQIGGMDTATVPP